MRKSSGAAVAVDVRTRTAYLSTAYAVVAWLILALAAVHMATTFRLASATNFTKLWFFGSGIAMAQTAALNLLHRSYARPALGWVTRGSNAAMLVLATVGGFITRASVGELVLVVGAFTALLLFSFLGGRSSRARVSR